jgi:hypothetical protein
MRFARAHPTIAGILFTLVIFVLLMIWLGTQTTLSHSAGSS